jgi:predicted enzyme related to lactoylglutathione lyase
MPRVVRFDLGIDQPDRAVKFYSTVFGWKIEQLQAGTEYWLASTGEDGQPGIDGGFVKRRYPTEMITCWIDVPSVDDFLKKITQNGGKAVTGRIPIPGVGYCAYSQDTEGNVFGIFQPDEQAK